MQTILEKLEQAKTCLILDHIFLGIHGTHLPFVEDTTCKTLWTDAEVIGYNPAYIASLPQSHLVGVLGHEIFHVAGGHCFRGLGKDAKTWNEACDYASNPVLLEMGFFLPPGVLIDAKYHQKTPEEIYYLLMQKAAQKQPQPQPQKQPQKQADKNGQEANPDATPDRQPGQDKPDDSANDAQAKPEQKPSDKADNSGKPDNDASASPEAPSDAKSEPDEDGEPVAPFGEIRQNANPQVEAKMKDIIKVAAMQANRRSQYSAGIKRLVKEVTLSPVEWIPLTHLFVQQIAPTDYSWRRPNRNYLHQGFYVPSLADNRLGKIYFGNDTSGSVSNFQQSCCQKMLRDLVSETRPESLTVIHCDNRVQKIEEFEEGDNIDISPIGGGGTDFRPVFEEIDRLGESPAGLIFLTDMDGEFPKTAPDYPVLWLSTTPNVKGPFGETVYLDLRNH